MGLKAICVVWAPNFFRPLVPTTDDYIIHAKTISIVLERIMENKYYMFNEKEYEVKDV